MFYQFYKDIDVQKMRFSVYNVLSKAMFQSRIAQPTSLLLCLVDFCSITGCQAYATGISD